MADLEVRKHAKAALKTITEKDEKGWVHKLKEFLLEIFIIVFAVSLSIGLHGWSDRNHKKEEVKEFLSDLKSDLLADKKEILNSKKEILQGRPETTDKSNDTVVLTSKMAKTNKNLILKNISRKTNSGNYEGFKSSGNISNIFNKPLKINILKYYEQDAKYLEDKEKMFNTQKERVLDIVFSSNKDALTPHTILLNSYESGVISKYNELIKSINMLIVEIDKEIGVDNKE